MNNLTYKIKENGYEIYNNGQLWIDQYEPYIPNPSLSYEENAKIQIEELSKPIESDNLKEQNNTQEEIIANLTYELMMLQEPIALANLNTSNHSPKYSLIKSWFNKGYWNEDMLLNAVERHYITEEEMNEIIG